jgi:hypothetical protein
VNKELQKRRAVVLVTGELATLDTHNFACYWRTSCYRRTSKLFFGVWKVPIYEKNKKAAVGRFTVEHDGTRSYAKARKS